MSTAYFRVRLLDEGKVIHDHIAFSPIESEAVAISSTLYELERGNWICNPGRSIVITDGSGIDLESSSHD